MALAARRIGGLIGCSKRAPHSFPFPSVTGSNHTAGSALREAVVSLHWQQVTLGSSPGPSKSRLVSCQSSWQQTSTSTTTSYNMAGALGVREVNLNVRVGGDAELPVTAQIEVTLPTSPGPHPLVVLSAGFLLNGSLYRSYAAHLASYGYAVALYDLNEVMDDVSTVNALRIVVDTCLKDSRTRQALSQDNIILAGHSRGGKLSCLAASKDRRVRGLLLLDPVDNTPMTPAGEGYPSCLSGLRALTQAGLPVLVVGAAEGRDMIPESGNYKRFVAACAGPTWEVDLLGAGHLAFIDKQIGLLSMFSAPGTTNDAAVRSASKVAMLTFLDHVVCPGAAQGRPVPPTSPAQAIQEAQREITKLALNLASYASRGLPSTNTSSNGGASGATSSSSSSAYSGASQERQQQQQQPASTSRRSSSSGGGSSNGGSRRDVTLSYDELMGLRARELKAMLLERGISCADCFEKEELAARLIERCGVRR